MFVTSKHGVSAIRSGRGKSRAIITSTTPSSCAKSPSSGIVSRKQEGDLFPDMHEAPHRGGRPVMRYREALPQPQVEGASSSGNSGKV